MGKKIILIIVGSIVWSLTMIRSGWLYNYGFGFWGPNGHDGVWHIALAESLSRGSLDNPVFAGSTLQNYHLGFDLLLGLINKITNIPINYLYFQILPLFFALGIGLLVYQFVYNWRRSKAEAFWSTFFVYFSSGFGFIITFLRDRQITGESLFWSQQTISTLVNPPFAMSLIFILAGLIAMQRNKKLLAIIFFGLLIQIKAYAAILILSGLFVVVIYQLFTTRYSLYAKVFLGSLFLNLILFFSIKSEGASVFIWQPFWFLETMMSYSDRLGWDKFYSAMTTYKMGHLWLKAILAYGFAFLIFIVGNMGLRILGFYYYYKIITKKFKIDWVIIFITTIFVASVVIPLFFVQKGTPWNTIQFFYYYLFSFSILTGIAISQLNKYIKILVVAFAIIGIWTTLQHYLPPEPQSFISKSELEALSFLKIQSQGVVLTYPFDQYKAKEAIKNPPRPLYLYESTAYVSAFSDKTVFMEDEVNLNIMGYDWKQRRQKVLDFILNLDSKKGKEFLTNNNIKYLYLVKNASPIMGEYLKLGSGDLALTKLFENKEAIIFKYEQN